MALLRSLILMLFCCVLLVKSDKTGQNSRQDEGYFPLILSLLDHLNSNPYRVYDYKKGSLLYAQNKADVVEMSVEVEVDCNNKYPDVPCTDQSLICHAFMGRGSEQSDMYHVLSDIKCSPKIDLIVEDVDVPRHVAPAALNKHTMGNGKLDLNNEAVPPEQGSADFVAVRKENVPCLGCRFDLSADAEGVDELIETAVKHIESERSNRHKITNVRRLQQQVVAGLKYILLVDVAQTACSKDADISTPCVIDTSVEPFTCEVTFIQQPWISKDKHIVRNNCTVTQEFEWATHTRSNRNDINNETTPTLDIYNSAPSMDQKPDLSNYNGLDHDTEKAEEQVSMDRVADLESQILTDDMIEKPVGFEIPKNLAPTYELPVKSETNLPSSNIMQERYLEVAALPSLPSTNVEDSKVEPLHSEQSDLSSLYVSLPIVDVVEPAILLYTPENTEYSELSSVNYIQKFGITPDLPEFVNFLPAYERIVRDLNEESDSNSDSGTRVTKEASRKIKGDAKRNKDSTSEESKSKSDSDGTSEEKKKGNERTVSENVDLVKGETDSSEESAESHNTSEENNINKREPANSSKDGSESNDGLVETNERNRRSLTHLRDTEAANRKIKRHTERNKYNSSDESSKSEIKSDSNSSSEERKKDTETDDDERTEQYMKRTRRGANRDDSSSSSSSSESKEENSKRARLLSVGSDDSSDSSDSSKSSDSSDNNEVQEKERLRKESDNKLDTSCESDSSEESNKRNKRTLAYLSAREKYSARRVRSIGQMEKISAGEKVVVRDLADFAAATLDNIDDDHHKRVILQILGAKKLKLDGIYYQIILRLGISQCHEHEHDENCRERLFANLTKICKVQVHMEDDYSNPKVVKSQCQNIKRDENDRNRTNYSRYRRSVLLGSKVPVPTDDPRLKKFLTATLQHLDSVSDHPNKHKAINIIYATSQVVAGTKYDITVKIGLTDCKKSQEKSPDSCELLENFDPEVCTVEIWDRPWLNKSIYTVKCNDKIYKFGDKDHSRKKRSAEQNDPDHQLKRRNAITMVLKALDYLSTKTGLGRVYRLMDAHILKHFVDKQSEVSIINGKVSLCERSGIMPLLQSTLLKCPDETEFMDCQFNVSKNSELLLGSKVCFRCGNDGQEYTYEPLEDLHSDEIEMVFRHFAVKYNKVYRDDTEFKFRLKVFRDNLNKINLLNRYEQGSARYGITQFADLTEKEFSRSHGLRPDLESENELPFGQAQIPHIELPTQFDWRTKDAVTEVKDQGMCGSCWAFSVTGDIEGQYAIKYGKLLEFSEQELVDCDKSDDGCNGGYMTNAYRAIEKLGGLEAESDYPYKGIDSGCHFNLNKVKVQLSGALNISHNETDMAKWLVQNGPISIAINANAMQFYVGGISHPWKSVCSPKNLDHGVLIVGYGVHTYALFNKTLPYWIVKNSWGKSWGEQGYYRVYRGDGTCGLNQMPSSAIVA